MIAESISVETSGISCGPGATSSLIYESDHFEPILLWNELIYLDDSMLYGYRYLCRHCKDVGYCQHAFPSQQTTTTAKSRTGI